MLDPNPYESNIAPGIADQASKWPKLREIALGAAFSISGLSFFGGHLLLCYCPEVFAFSAASAVIAFLLTRKEDGRWAIALLFVLSVASFAWHAHKEAMLKRHAEEIRKRSTDERTGNSKSRRTP